MILFGFGRCRNIKNKDPRAKQKPANNKKKVSEDKKTFFPPSILPLMESQVTRVCAITSAASIKIS